MTISLLDLPNELLLHLGEIAPDSVLNSLILTNRRLAQLLNPVLWKFGDNEDDCMDLSPNDLPFACGYKINNAAELLSFAIERDNPLMAKKILQHGGLDYESDPDTMNSALRSAVATGQSAWVDLLLTAVEGQSKAFGSDTLLAMVRIAMDRDSRVTTERLFRHSKIPKRNWRNAGKRAIQLQNEHLLRLVLDHGQPIPPPEQADFNYLFHYAAILDHVPSLQMLWERGADINSSLTADIDYRQEPVLHAAAWRNNIDAVTWLLDHGADINIRGQMKQTVVAASIGKLPMLKLLVSRGADIYQRDWRRSSPLVRAYCSEHHEEFLYLLSLQGGLRPGLGMEKEDLSRCIMCMATSRSPKLIAVLLDHVDLAQEGEDILFNTANRGGNSLLLKALHDRGVSLAARRDSGTVLHSIALSYVDWYDHSLEQRNCEAAEFVLNLHPEAILEVDKDGNTPLHAVASTDRPSLMRLFLQWGASPRAVNHDGKTPAQLIPSHLGPSTRELLEAYS